MARQRSEADSEATPHERRTREAVEAWKASGLTAASFAPRLGIAPATLFGWQWALRRRDREREGGAAARFVGVRVVDRGPARPPSFDVVLPGRRVVRVRVGFDERELSRLLAVVEARAC
jgi:hypothetical protein